MCVDVQRTHVTQPIPHTGTIAYEQLVLSMCMRLRVRTCVPIHTHTRSLIFYLCVGSVDEYVHDIIHVRSVGLIGNDRSNLPRDTSVFCPKVITVCSSWAVCMSVLQIDSQRPHRGTMDWRSWRTSSFGVCTSQLPSRVCGMYGYLHCTH